MISIASPDNDFFCIKNLKSEIIYQFPINRNSVISFSVYKNKCAILYDKCKIYIAEYSSGILQINNTVTIIGKFSTIINILLLENFVLILTEYNCYKLDIILGDLRKLPIFKNNSRNPLEHKNCFRINNKIVITSSDGRYIYNTMLDFNLKVIHEGYINEFNIDDGDNDDSVLW